MNNDINQDTKPSIEGTGHPINVIGMSYTKAMALTTAIIMAPEDTGFKCLNDEYQTAYIACIEDYLKQMYQAMQQLNDQQEVTVWTPTIFTQEAKAACAITQETTAIAKQWLLDRLAEQAAQKRGQIDAMRTRVLREYEAQEAVA